MEHVAQRFKYVVGVADIFRISMKIKQNFVLASRYDRFTILTIFRSLNLIDSRAFHLTPAAL